MNTGIVSSATDCFETEADGIMYTISFMKGVVLGMHHQKKTVAVT